MNSAPTIFVIFGVTGDLSQRKLLPALFNLYTHNLLPKKFKIVGFSRRPWEHHDLHTFVDGVLKNANKEKKQDFLKHIEYAQGVFDDAKVYELLKKQLDVIDGSWGQCSNKLLYMAVSPAFYETIFDMMEKSGLNIPCGGELGWTRILVEKPFGKDTKTAEQLEKKLSKIFKELQIFRIDHYLAKETMQNILTFRFSNSIFEPLWNADVIEKVHLKVSEDHGIRDRGAFYDGVGALRDVGQNHLLQMLALIAMDRPKAGEDVREKRAAVLKKLSFPKSALKETVRGQYEGFTKEKGVASDSKTETYFKLPAYIDLKRWHGVPFILESGKALKEFRAEITVYFKRLECAEQNIVRFKIQPDEGIEIVFWVKKPGLENEHKQKTLSFSYESSKFENELPDAYEKVLYDAVMGDQTLFASTDEVKYSWEFITPILEQWEKLPLHVYAKGTEGPKLKNHENK